MAKIDRIKELLNTLRVAMSVIVGLLVIVTGSLINKEQLNQIDIYFYAGAIVNIVLLYIFIILILAIRKNIEKIGEL